MEKSFLNVEDILADESFLSWYFKQSDEKIQTWELWLTNHPEQQPLVDKAISIMSQLHISEKEISENQLLSAVEKLNKQIDEINRHSVPVLDMQKSRKRWWMTAAAAILIASAGFFIWKFSGSNKKIFATNYGQLSQHILPDGSEVMLNANSTVKLGNNWENGGDREVWLKGEAFFHVKKTSTHDRFIVHANKMDVIVTGTQFNVITRDDKNSVLLTEGSVTVLTNDGNEIKMVPGDFVEITTDKLEKKAANEEAVLAWKGNKLFFDGTLMKDASKIISDHYGVKLILADDSVSMKPLNGMMPNDNLDVLLKALEATGDFKITRNENQIIVSNP
jgi:ferric-dicitrate binding protein FerR (iron transport regulator)